MISGLVLLPETTLDDAMPLAQRILRNARQNILKNDAGDVRYTTSIGLAQLRQDDTHTDSLMARADAAAISCNEKWKVTGLWPNRPMAIWFFEFSRGCFHIDNAGLLLKYDPARILLNAVIGSDI